MPWWRWSLLALVTLLFVAWTAVAAVNLLAAVTKDCAEAASEISDPCAMGRGLWTLGTLLIWVAGALPLAYAWGWLRKGRNRMGTPAREDG